MFTDQPATPTRVETLIDLVRNLGPEKLTKDELRKTISPDGLPDLTPNSDQARQTIAAAEGLGLISSNAEGKVDLNVDADKRPSRDILLEAFDNKVLANTDLEPWFSLFYSYLLGRESGSAAPGKKDGDRWEVEFNRDVLQGKDVANRFNRTKYDGMRRWMRYVGLGWHDSSDVFQPNPYERVRRSLGKLFGKETRMDSDTFIKRLGDVCPELDGGKLFRRANTDWDPSHRRCTRGLSHALMDLHMDGIILLNCPPDSRGCNLEAASPPRDRDRLQSDLFDTIELPPNAERTRVN
jgi:hypothetical protein